MRGMPGECKGNILEVEECKVRGQVSGVIKGIPGEIRWMSVGCQGRPGDIRGMSEKVRRSQWDARADQGDIRRCQYNARGMS